MQVAGQKCENTAEMLGFYGEEEVKSKENSGADSESNLSSSNNQLKNTKMPKAPEEIVSL